MIRLLNGRPVYWLTCTTRVRKYSGNFSDNEIDIYYFLPKRENYGVSAITGYI